MRHLLASSFPTLKQYGKECKQMLLSFENRKGSKQSSLKNKTTLFLLQKFLQVCYRWYTLPVGQCENVKFPYILGNNKLLSFVIFAVLIAENGFIVTLI